MIEQRIVSPSIARRLKAIHPGLFAVWNRKLERWVIKKFDKDVTRDTGKPGIILVIQDLDGNYAPIDQWVYNNLREQWWNAQKRINELLYEMDEVEAKREKDTDQDFEDMASAEVATLRRQYY